MKEVLDRLARRVERIEERLDGIEARLGVEIRPVVDDVQPGPSAEDRGGPRSALAAAGLTLELVPLVGRTLVVLGGAFALRAITESGVVPQSFGTMLGIGYAVLWLLFTDRAAARKRATSAAFHALSAASIGFPLLAEATLRFGSLSLATSAAVLVAITGLALAIAARRQLRAVAWLFTLSAAGTATVLGVLSRAPLLSCAVLLLLSLASLLLAYGRRWAGPAIFVALVADGMFLLLGVMVLVGDADRVAEVLDTTRLVGLQLGLLILYLGAFFGRALLARKPIATIEIVQGVAVLLIGLGGATAVTEATGMSNLPLGVVGLLLALSSYAASFTFIDRASERRVSFIFYTTTALVFTLVAIEMLFEGPTRVAVLAGIALAAALIGSARKRATLNLHGAVYLVAATAGSVLPGAVVASFTARSSSAAAWMSGSVLVVLAVAAIGGWLSVATHGATWGRLSVAPKIVSLLLLLAGLAGLAVSSLATLLPAGEDGLPDGASLASLRTAVLALAALGLARIGRSTRLREAGWLVYPLLALGGVKLLVEDLQTGRPATLFVSFALYGSALILAPRLARRREQGGTRV